MALDTLVKEVQGGRLTPENAWTTAVSNILTHEQDFERHKQAAALLFSSWDVGSKGPPPLWSPTEALVQSTNLATFIRQLQAYGVLPQTSSIQDAYQHLYRFSIQQPEQYWEAVIRALQIQFQRPPTRILQEVTHPDECQWLPGACLNIAAAALTSPRAAPAEHPAILWADEGAPTCINKVPLPALRQEAEHTAACLLAAGCCPGDAVALVLPMTAQAVAVYLGVVLAGCSVVSIADSFSSDEIAVRLRIAGAKAVITQDALLRGGKAHPLLPRVLKAQPPRCIVIQRIPGAGPPQGLRQQDFTWTAFCDLAPGGVPTQPHMAAASHIINILFSSGTTGEPKAIPWTQITPIKCAADAWAHQDLAPSRVAAWPTSMGWMMGPWLVFACLLNGASIALYQGSPLGRDFGEFVQAAGVEMLGVVPSIVRAWRHSNCMQGLDWSRIRCFSSTGEASAPEDYHWLMAQAGYRPIIEYCGGTELGGSYATGTLLQPQAPSTFSTPTLGTSMYLLAGDGSISTHLDGQPGTGEIALGGLLLGASQTLLNRSHRGVYFDGMPQDPAGPPGRPIRRHGDEFQRWPGGRCSALGRCDDTMNLGGIKVGSVEIERAVTETVEEVADAAAVSVPMPGGGPEQLYMFVVLKPGAAKQQQQQQRLLQDCRAAVRTRLNPLFKVERVVVVESLPRTATNKVMRRVLRDQVLASPARKSLQSKL